jgi:hypothetical protein
VQPLSAEGRCLADAKTESVMAKSSVLPQSTYYEMLDYFRTINKKRHIPDDVYDVFYATRDNPDPNLQGKIRACKYGDIEKSLIEVTEDFLARRKEYLSRACTLPFQIKLVVKDNSVDYVLVAWFTGRYFLLAGHRPGVYNTVLGPLAHALPSKAILGKVRCYVHFAWEFPEGAVTLSTEWFVDFSKISRDPVGTGDSVT